MSELMTKRYFTDNEYDYESAIKYFFGDNDFIESQTKQYCEQSGIISSIAKLLVQEAIEDNVHYDMEMLEKLTSNYKYCKVSIIRPSNSNFVACCNYFMCYASHRTLYLVPKRTTYYCLG